MTRSFKDVKDYEEMCGKFRYQFNVADAIKDTHLSEEYLNTAQNDKKIAYWKTHKDQLKMCRIFQCVKGVNATCTESDICPDMYFLRALSREESLPRKVELFFGWTVNPNYWPWGADWALEYATQDFYQSYFILQRRYRSDYMTDELASLKYRMLVLINDLPEKIGMKLGDFHIIDTKK